MPSPRGEEFYVNQIRGLLALAEDPATPEAAANAARDKASELIIKWEIDEAKLTAAGDERLKNEQIIAKTVKPKGPVTYAHELSLIGGRVADALGMRGFITSYWDPGTGRTRGTHRPAYKIVGFESDVQRAEMLIASLITQCLAGLDTYVRDMHHSYEWGYMSGTDRFQAKRGFIQGFSIRVADRLAALRKVQVDETTGTSTDLVLVDRSDRVNGYVASQMKIGPGRARTYDSSGARAGMHTGDRADIGQQRFGQAARGALDGA